MECQSVEGKNWPSLPAKVSRQVKLRHSTLKLLCLLQVKCPGLLLPHKNSNRGAIVLASLVRPRGRRVVSLVLGK